MVRCLAFPVVALLLFAAAPSSSSAQDAAAAAPRPGPQVNINAATAEQLEELPGVGPKMAARIVEYRQKNGGFKKVEDLMNVRGLGEKNFLKLKPFITVGASRTDRAGGQ